MNAPVSTPIADAAGWRTDFENAKDGTVILVVHAGRTLAAYYALADGAMKVEADRRHPWEILDGTNGTNAISNPTRWQPLPPPPESGT